MTFETSCSRFIDDLDDYRRNQLPAARTHEMQQHLENCTACKTELADREAMADALRQSLPVSSSPTALPSSVKTTILQAYPPYSAKAKRRRNLLPGMLAAASILLIGIGVMYLSPSRNPTNELATTLDSDISAVYFEELTETTRKAQPRAPFRTFRRSETALDALAETASDEMILGLEQPASPPASQGAFTLLSDSSGSSLTPKRELLRERATAAVQNSEQTDEGYSGEVRASRTATVRRDVGTMFADTTAARFESDYIVKKPAAANVFVQSAATTESLTTATLTTNTIETTHPLLPDRQDHPNILP